jgi:arylsulfatase A-like enzyme
MRFTDFYMASPVGSPSRGAMLTGCYPPRIGFGEFDGHGVLYPGHRLGLHPDEVTIAKVLSEAGYATKLVGKWHCGDQPPFLPTRHGFDGYFGLPYSNDMGRQVWYEGLPPLRDFMRELGLELPVDEMPPLPLLLDDEVLEAQPDQAALTARYVDDCVRFLRANRGRPWFLYLAHLYVHTPIYVLDPFARASRNGTYGAAVASIDWAAAVLLQELARLGLEENTIVIFTSDNGSRGRDGGSNQPLRGAKTSTWEGGMRVPCIARWPGRIPAGTVTSAMTSAMDLFPTLANLAHATIPDDRVIDGRDIGAVLLGVDENSPHDAFFFYRANDLKAVRSGRWKLFVARKGESVDELYDLEEDIGERTNVFEREPTVVAELIAHVERARAELGDARLGIIGSGTRPVGVVDHPETLTTYDPNHPYCIAEYDLPDRG